MGFRDKVYRESHESVFQTLVSFKTILDEIEQMTSTGLRILSDPKWNRSRLRGLLVKSVTFSDSILLFSGDSSSLSLYYLLFRTQQVVNKAMSLFIPLKGAISFGKQTADFDKSIYFGQPLIDAYELQDQILLYSVVLHHTTEKYINDIDDKAKAAAVDLLLARYHTPLKNCTADHYLLKWESNEVISTVLPQLYNTVSGSPRVYVDNTAKYLAWLKSQEKRK